ncbi:MAG: hypothetical protein A2W98_07005 [Bacteroidetes bacterium GWF2_33_38]|nr:MAG: hypothetical protein A2W98_07005 [Bacteroidetes bacterium GWF2_33_38]OFY72428.1 MAG: hypothetical protein A2265_05350 [Bacteroidetes bacterium RIFOXYA12_FULL_33_9]OFY89350.1 MAG: hypothetical protein A2236_08115 [Bacteroidetes bacterium RIFOXYA2_FULL_33_7]
MFEKYEKIPDMTWNKENIIKIEVNIDDTVSLHNVYINIRNTGQYKYSNLYIFMKAEGVSNSFEDTIDCILADDSGRWLGDGLGDLWDSQYLIRQNVRFPNAGKYTFHLQQGMRDDLLEDVSDVGISIEKSIK